MKVLHIARRKVSPNLSELRYGYDLEHFKALASFLEENHVLFQSSNKLSHKICLGNLFFHLAPNLPLMFPTAIKIAAKCNLIVAQNPFIAGLIAVLTGMMTRKPVLISIHGYRFTVGRIQYSLRRFVCLRSTIIRAVSEAVKSMVASWGVPEDKIRVVKDRVDCSFFNPNVKGDDVRKKFNLTDKPVVLYAGALAPIKGVDILVRAAKEVLRKVPEAAFLIVGEGLLKEKLRELARSLGIESSIIFTGKVSYYEMPSYMAACDILAHPSYSEGLPRVLLEAQSSGKPIVATKVGGVPEAVKEGETAILVSAGDAKGLAEAIVYLLERRELALRMGEEGRRFVEEVYEFWRQELKLIKLYYEAVRGRFY